MIFMEFYDEINEDNLTTFENWCLSKNYTYIYDFDQIFETVRLNLIH
jgi:hypothetical protein